MRRTVIAIRRRRGRDGGQDGQPRGATRVLAHQAVWVGAAEITLFVFVEVSGLYDAREEDCDGHRQGDAPADADVQEGTWKRSHTLTAVASGYEPV